MFDQILDVTLPEEKVSTTRVTQGNIKIFLRPNSPDSHQTQIQEGEILDWPHVLIFLKENPIGRQGKKCVTNSRAAAHENWMVKC